MNKTKSWMFKEINKIDTFLARLTKAKKKKKEPNKIINEKEITTDITEIKRIIRSYY